MLVPPLQQICSPGQSMDQQGDTMYVPFPNVAAL